MIAAMSVSCSSAERVNNPVEVGSVQWQRDYTKAVESAKTTSKPLLILFQEVPG